MNGCEQCDALVTRAKESARRAAAQAWDEGFQAQAEQSLDRDGKPVGLIIRNPYRDDRTPDEES